MVATYWDQFHLVYVILPLWLVVLGVRWRRRRADQRTSPPPVPDPEKTSIAFGYKTSWLAIRSGDPATVAAALRLARVQPVTWPGGLSQAYRSDTAVFVSPPVDGWVLAVGAFGVGHGRDEDLAELSRRFGEVQLFSTHRVVEYHEWQRWIDGRSIRRYAYVGESHEVLFDDGEPGDVDAGVPSPHDLDDDDLDWERIPDEQTVIDIAAAWSVDPTTLEGRGDVDRTGGVLGYRVTTAHAIRAR